MKSRTAFLLSTLAAVAAVPTATAAAAAFSALSSFAGTRYGLLATGGGRGGASSSPFAVSSPRRRTRQAAATSFVMYDSSRDPPSSPDYNAWTVLSNTERWISNTLQGLNAGGGVTGMANNPYARKEVSYACETSSDNSMVVANVFRRLREVRELGERHGEEEVKRADAMGSSYEPSTLRQTQVLVIPGSDQLNSFPVFDGLVGAINQARRNARDYVTDVALDKLDDRLEADEDDDDWSVSINCAHLHPEFGVLTPEQEMEKLKQEDEEGEVDVNLQEYKEKKLMARRSPYPTLVIEVRAVPPPDFGSAPPPPSSSQAGGEDEPTISSTDIQKLEALFGRSAHVGHPKEDLSPKEREDAFYSAIGSNSGITEISSVTPLALAQQFVAANDPDLKLSPHYAAFTESGASHVDEAYQFVFTNLAMMKESAASGAASAAAGPPPAAGSAEQRRQYLVMPHFLSSSATSFEKFSNEVRNIFGVLPDLKDKASIETFHPEHVDSSRRSPVPIYVLIWKE